MLRKVDLDSRLAALEPVDLSAGVQELYEGSADAQRSPCREITARLRLALRNDEFRLYRQSVKSLVSDARSFHEIVIRQAEEEQNMMPPGAFFALAEECALMPELDRWVVSGILRSVFERRHSDPKWQPPMYCVSLSGETISDPFFPDFVAEQAACFGLSPRALCFQVQESDAVARRTDTVAMVKQLRTSGIRMMLAGFGREKLCFNILKDARFDFLKIDGGLTLNFRRSEASMTKLRGILRVAGTVGIGTVAELVETEEIIATLRELGVNYAQGSAISDVLPITAPE